MTKPVIAVDIDEVLGEYAPEFVAFSNERWGTNLRVEDYHENWSELWQIEHDQARPRVDAINNSDIVTRLKPVAHADRALELLSERYDIVLVTARPTIFEKDTRAWLERHYKSLSPDIHFIGMFDGVITDTSYLKTKSLVYSQIQPVFVIDDQIKHCQAAADLGIDAILFGDYPWNRDKPENDLITRCADWNHVMAHIEARS